MIWLVCSPKAKEKELRIIRERYKLLCEAEMTVQVLCTVEQSSFFTEEECKNYKAPEEMPALGPQAGLSYGLMLEAREHRPDLIVCPLRQGLGYYTLLQKWTGSKALENTSIVIDKTNFAQEESRKPEFLFPWYLLRRMELFCTEAADALLGDGSGMEIELIRQLKNSNRKKDLFPFPELSSGSFATPEEEEKLLSIVIPYYNLGKTVEETVESAFSSDYPHREILLLDDGSDERESIEMLGKLKRNYPELQIHTLEHGGLFQLRNRAASLAKGAYLTFLDADDTVEPGYYTRAISVLENYSNVAYVSSWVRYFGELEQVEPFFNTDLPLLLLRNMHTSFAVSRRELYKQFAVNQQAMEKGFEDHEAWIRMAEEGCLGACIPEPLCNYRLRSDSLTGRYTTELRLSLYDSMVRLHPALYEKYQQEVQGLLQANGPAYIWPNPTLPHRELSYKEEESEIAAMKQELAHTLDDLAQVQGELKKTQEDHALTGQQLLDAKAALWQSDHQNEAAKEQLARMEEELKAAQNHIENITASRAYAFARRMQNLFRKKE